VHEVYLTYERQIGADMSLSLSGRLNRARNLPIAIDTNLASAGTQPDGTPKWTATGRPNPAFGNIFVSESTGYQNYRGLVTTLTKRFSHGASFQISHHWSHVEGAAYVSDFTGFGIFTTPSNPQDLSSDVGLGDFDMPQRLTVTGVFEPSSASLHGIAGTILNGWQVSPRIVATKGYPFSPLTGLDTNGDSVFNDRPSGYAYNSFRVPGYYAIDGRITRKIKLNAQTLELIVEGFNLANQLTPTGPSAINRTWGTGTTPNATFITLISSQASRQIQIAARLTF